MGQARRLLPFLAAASLAAGATLPSAHEDLRDSSSDAAGAQGSGESRRATMRREMPVGSLAVEEEDEDATEAPQVPETTHRLYPAFSSTEMPVGKIQVEEPFKPTTTTVPRSSPNGTLQVDSKSSSSSTHRGASHLSATAQSRQGTAGLATSHNLTTSTKPTTTTTTTTKSTTTKEFVEPQTTTMLFEGPPPETLKQVWVVDGCPKNTIRAEQKKEQLVASDGIYPVRCCSHDGKSCGSSFVGCVKSSRSVAEEVCAHHKLRLCKKEEVASNLCCDTGCNFDHELVWAIDTGFEKEEWAKTTTTTTATRATTTTTADPATATHPHRPRPTVTTTEPCEPVTTPEPCEEVKDTTTAKP